MAKETIKAWAAGIIDGEGYIAREKRSKNSTQIVVKVDNTDEKMLQVLALKFGGNVYLTKARKDRPHCKPLFYWRLVSKKAAIFLEAIMPYLVTKKDKAIVILR